MSIKGMTDRGMEFPQIGIIRKGAPKGGNTPGKDLDYFRVVFDEAESDTLAAFIATFGTQPKQIKVLLPFDDIERCWDANVEAYTAGGLVYLGNGMRALFWVDPETGEVKVKDGNPLTPCVGVDGLVGYYKTQNGKREPIKAKALGRLRVIVPDLKRLAYLLVVTSSKWDVMHISDQLAALKHINGGRLAGIPLTLSRKPAMVSVPMGSKRGRVKKWLIHIEAESNWARAQFEALNRYALPEGSELPQLPAGQIIDQPSAGSVGVKTADDPIEAEWRDEEETAEPWTEEIAGNQDEAPADPLTEGLYTNTSKLKPETVSNWTTLVKEAKAVPVNMNFDLDETDTVQILRDRAAAIRAVMAQKKVPA